MNYEKQLIRVAALICMAVWLTGCGHTKWCVCAKNKQEGYATIVCQPNDVEAFPGDTVKFKVVATGSGLQYQWYFTDGMTNSPAHAVGVTNAQTAEITIPVVTSAHVGHYWANIDSIGAHGLPKRTRTRDAGLSLNVPSETSKVDGTNINSYAGATADAPDPVNPPQADPCGTHCSWTSYYNSPTGFDPEPGSTRGYIRVKVGASFLLQNQFTAKWVSTGTAPPPTTGCAVVAPVAEERSFPVVHTRFYFITVYLTGVCPPKGTKVLLYLDFRSL